MSIHPTEQNPSGSRAGRSSGGSEQYCFWRTPSTPEPRCRSSYAGVHRRGGLVEGVHRHLAGLVGDSHSWQTVERDRPVTPVLGGADTHVPGVVGRESVGRRRPVAGVNRVDVAHLLAVRRPASVAGGVLQPATVRLE